MKTVEEKTVTIRFDGDKKTYSLVWTELLREDGMPFSSLDELTDGVTLQAPYTDGESSAVSFWPAVIVDKGWLNLIVACWHLCIYRYTLNRTSSKKSRARKRKAPIANANEPAAKKSRKVSIKTVTKLFFSLCA